MSPCPIVEKNNSLTDIPVKSRFFLAFWQKPRHEVSSSVIHTHLPPLPTPQLQADHAQCRPVHRGSGYICIALGTVGDTRVCQTKVLPSRINCIVFRARCKMTTQGTLFKECQDATAEH